MGQDDGPRPIYSTRADDLASSEAIDGFVVGLAERVDTLQDAEGIRDFKQLASLASSLAIDAVEVGYDSLSRCAAKIETACLGDQSEDAHKDLVELTELSQRIRLGHRGAA